MCGAKGQPYSWEEIYRHYEGFVQSLSNDRLNIAPHYNLRPTQSSPIVRVHEDAGKVEVARWGLLPIWAKPEKLPRNTFNARRDRIEEQLAGKRGMWGAPFKKHRCLVVSGGFYEWTGPKGNKQPWFIHKADRSIMSFAGMCAWHPELGVSYTVITMPPTPNIQPYHDRMPVVVKPEHYQAWLSAEHGADDALAILDDHATGELVAYQVSRELVNYGKNSPECMEPLAA